MKKEIKYIGYYDILRDGRQYREYSLAAAKKMDYICRELNNIGYDVRIISPSHVSARGDKKVHSVSERIGDRCFLELPPSCEATHKVQRVWRVLMARMWLFNYLIRHTEKNEPVLVYHNYNVALPVILAQKIKGFKIVLEIEDIYFKVWKLSRLQEWKEKKLLRYADNNSLVVSEVLAKELKIQNPTVSYGSYTICNGAPIKAEDKSIRLILTGSVDKERGNGFLAVEAIRYLPSKYKLFISGSVAPKAREEFFDLIHTVNNELQREACVYVGLLDDREYERFLLSADVALNPQRDGEFGKYIFPSKILTYLGHGLPVVSTPGESIVESKLADIITFSEGFNGQSIAEAIKNVKIEDRGVYFDYLTEIQSAFQEKLTDVFKDE